MERQGARDTGNDKICVVATDGQNHIYKKVKSDGKNTSLKIVLAIVCSIVAIAFASATIFIITKVMNNEKLLEKLSSTFNAPSMNLSDTNRSHLDCSTYGKDGVLITKTGEKLLCSQGWTVFQRRIDGRLADFHIKTWEEYANGFGDVNGEFWLGLRKLHQITNRGGCKLRVDLWSWDNKTAYAEYGWFSVASEAEKFKLEVAGHSGTEGNGMGQLVGSNRMEFSTMDRNSGRHFGDRCPPGFQRNSGGWWHSGCGFTIPNAIYGRSSQYGEAIFWSSWKKKISMKSTMLKVRCS